MRRHCCAYGMVSSVPGRDVAFPLRGGLQSRFEPIQSRSVSLWQSRPTTDSPAAGICELHVADTSRPRTTVRSGVARAACGAANPGKAEEWERTRARSRGGGPLGATSSIGNERAKEREQPLSSTGQCVRWHSEDPAWEAARKPFVPSVLSGIRPQVPRDVGSIGLWGLRGIRGCQGFPRGPSPGSAQPSALGGVASGAV
jgi:hypothetical protein